MPTAAATTDPNMHVHVLPDPTCPGCGAWRQQGHGVWWCENCATEEPITDQVRPNPEPVTMPGKSVLDSSGADGAVNDPGVCTRCGHARAMQWGVFVCPGCGSTPDGSQYVPPAEPVPVPTKPAAVLPFEVLHCLGEECQRAQRNICFGQLVCPVCGDSRPYPGEPEGYDYLRPTPTNVQAPKPLKSAAPPAPVARQQQGRRGPR